MSELSLKLGSQEFFGWQEINLKTGMRQLSGTFNLKVSDKWPGDIPARQIKKGAKVQARIDGETVMTGWVEGVPKAHDPRSHSITIKGRDVTADLIDCSAGTHKNEFKDQSLTQISKALCEPYNIPVRAETDVGEKFPSESVQIGETVHDMIKRLCRQRGVMAITDGKGGLVLTRAGRVHSGAQLILGENILSGSSTEDTKDRYSEYIVKGQQRSTFYISPEQAAGPKAIVKDPAVTRFRPLILIAEAQSDDGRLVKRAKFERNTRAGASTSATIKTNGWQTSAGKAWRPNTLVTVRDELLDLNGDYLITDTNFQKGEEGTTTELTIAPPETFELIDFPKEPEWGF
jgi:prophage tail gpP-like protein